MCEIATCKRCGTFHGTTTSNVTNIQKDPATKQNDSRSGTQTAQCPCLTGVREAMCVHLGTTREVLLAEDACELRRRRLRDEHVMHDPSMGLQGSRVPARPSAEVTRRLALRVCRHVVNTRHRTARIFIKNINLMDRSRRFTRHPFYVLVLTVLLLFIGVFPPYFLLQFKSFTFLLTRMTSSYI